MAEVLANGESKAGFVNTERFIQENVKATESHARPVNRKEKRKAAKKVKRKLVRRQLAEKEREEEEARLNDPEEQLRMEKEEHEEAEKAERERKLFEEREAMWIERSRKLKEEPERKHPEESEKEEVVECDDATSQSDSWEYVEEGPAEIIWQGNEIIVKKKKIRVPKTSLDDNRDHDAASRPTSNPLPPQSALFDDYTRAASVSTEALFESVATQVPNFGTEQDKAHCPFHIKTGACRFGSRCNRVHFYPDKSCTLLLKNMYNGPGLAWEQDEGLEYSEEEVELYFEDFYEDVHTEFLKFGEIINFKVCRNGSSHLRGNVYVHYKYLESAILAYNSINGRFFAGKQVTCEFIGVTRWKVAICGEYMKASYKTCSRGSACNFLHCFRNPGGDYEWADRDSSRPRYWVEKMVSLFGPSARAEEERVQNEQIISRNITSSNSRHRSAKHRSPDTHDSNGDSRRENLDHDDRSRHRKHSRMMKPDRIVCGNLHEAECLDRDSDKSHSDDPGGHSSGISRGRVHHRQHCSIRTADSFQNDDFDLPIMDRWTGDVRSDEDRGPHRGGYASKGGRYHLDRHGSCEKNDTHIDDDHNRRKRSRASSGSNTFDRKSFERYDGNMGNHNFNEVVPFSDDSVQRHDFQDGRISSKGDNKSSDDSGSSYQTQHDHHRPKRPSCSRERNRHVTKSKQTKMVVVDTDELKPKEKIANDDEVTDGRSRLDPVDKKHASKSSKRRDRKRRRDEESDTSDDDFDRRRERWR